MKPQTPQLVVVDEVTRKAQAVLEAPVAEVAAPAMPTIVVPDLEPKVVEAPESGVAASGS